MKRIIFTGKSDKRDLLLFICKALGEAGKRALLVDLTDGGKYRYILGGGDSVLSVTEFCGFDICDGMLGEPAGSEYDFCLYDMETMHFGTRELWSMANEALWVTSFDRYEVERTVEWFKQLFVRWPELQMLELWPVFIRTVDSSLKPEYILSGMEGLPVRWSRDVLEIPWCESNLAVQLENEYRHILRMARLSRSYKKALRTLLEELAGWTGKDARKTLRQAERRRA
ncbi:hypothetical protein FRY98_13210 [Paenibacillus faecis]|uniref:Uncharacterized protein n=1 Tax=Paenibacillus faecis TaxID=862114 RepID=A0A5D0CUJ5_9BACL|nr:hypothetical protein [Paenibacillus faecis]TYA13593.1 hypothetical protein FRY98_13210 [Paenibacillus faecis]